jgi:predicted dehydrogenase
MNSLPLDVVMLGAGSRGTFTYGQYALEHPDQVRVVAVAEPDAAKRARFAQLHNLPPDRCFERWDELVVAEQMAPALICALPDREHAEATAEALYAGYDVLLEKPMAVTPEDCMRIVTAGEASGKLLMISHVLRYTPFFSTLHEIIRSGRLGEIVTVEHRENVAFWHMAHSYVRGNWSNVERSAPMILAKCCHDLDILVWNMAGNPVTRLHSFGSLQEFRPRNAPPGAPDRCLDGCPAAETCPYYAPRIYLGDNTGWPVNTVTADLSYEGRLRALQTGPYGRCVYHCDNDAVDHQIVSMEHAGGALVTLVMHGHSDEEARTMRYDGTRATLRGRFGVTSEITVHDHLTGAVEAIEIDAGRGGHGGGDEGLMEAFIHAVRTRAGSLTNARMSLESHLLAFAAEASRAAGTAIEMDAFRAGIERTLEEPALH